MAIRDHIFARISQYDYHTDDDYNHKGNGLDDLKNRSCFHDADDNWSLMKIFFALISTQAFLP